LAPHSRAIQARPPARRRVRERAPARRRRGAPASAPTRGSWRRAAVAGHTSSVLIIWPRNGCVRGAWSSRRRSPTETSAACGAKWRGSGARWFEQMRCSRLRVLTRPSVQDDSPGDLEARRAEVLALPADYPPDLTFSTWPRRQALTRFGATERSLQELGSCHIVGPKVGASRPGDGVHNCDAAAAPGADIGKRQAPRATAAGDPGTRCADAEIRGELPCIVQVYELLRAQGMDGIGRSVFLAGYSSSLATAARAACSPTHVPELVRPRFRASGCVYLDPLERFSIVQP
jgi:hypothetical protein